MRQESALEKYGRGTVSSDLEGSHSWVPYGSGRYLLPERFSLTVDVERHPKCVFEFVIEHGHIVCDAVRVERRPGEPRITWDTLRRIKVDDWISVARETVGMEVVTGEDGRPELRPVRVGQAQALDPSQYLKEYLESYEESAQQRRRGARLGDAHFRTVAEVYRDALASGSRRPAVEVAERLYTSPQNARRWIMTARKRGFLGDAISERRAGEQKSKTGKEKHDG